MGLKDVLKNIGAFTWDFLKTCASEEQARRDAEADDIIANERKYTEIRNKDDAMRWEGERRKVEEAKAYKKMRDQQKQAKAEADAETAAEAAALKYDVEYSEDDEEYDTHYKPASFKCEEGKKTDNSKYHQLKIDYENNLHEFVFAFSSNELNFSITNYNVNDLSNISYSIKNINNIDYYIFQDDNGMHHATFYYNDRQHNLTHKNYEELIYILKFMKGSL